MAAARAGGVPVDQPAGGKSVGTSKPAHGTAREIVDVGTLPRQIDPLDRAPAGTQRFKFRYDDESHQPMIYVLAAKGDVDSAKAFYLKLHNLTNEKPLVVTALPD